MATKDLPLSEADEKIIDHLREGRNLPSNIAEDVGFTRQYVSNRIKRLREHGYVENIGNGVYELGDVADDGGNKREEPNPVDPDDPIFDPTTFEAGEPTDTSERVDEFVAEAAYVDMHNRRQNDR